jgi:ATP-dependent 26S proteasome regulatory subunit
MGMRPSQPSPPPGFRPAACLWATTPEAALDLENLAKEHSLSGGAIMNVIRYASLQALQQARKEIQLEDVLQGIRREYAKESKGE